MGGFVCYTTFSIPGRGCCVGPAVSALPACWASCKTGMLHSGHTFLTSSHLMRHLGPRQEGRKEGRRKTVRAENRQTKTRFFSSFLGIISAKALHLHPFAEKLCSFQDLSTRGQRSLKLQIVRFKNFKRATARRKRQKPTRRSFGCVDVVLPALLVTSGYFLSLQSAQSPLTTHSECAALDVVMS